MFLIPRQALLSHPHQQMVWLCRLQDGDSILIQYTISHPLTLHTQWNTVTHCCSPVALCTVGCIMRQIWHLLKPSHPPVPLVWPYCRQAQCGCWCSLKWIIADLLTSSHPQMSASHLLGLKVRANGPSYKSYSYHMNSMNWWIRGFVFFCFFYVTNRLQIKKSGKTRMFSVKSIWV